MTTLKLALVVTLLAPPSWASAEVLTPTPADFAELNDGAAVPFDYVWFTARHSQADPCAGMVMKLPAPAAPPKA